MFWTYCRIRKMYSGSIINVIFVLCFVCLNLVDYTFSVYQMKKVNPGLRSCPVFDLKNGLMKLRSRGRIARFVCGEGFKVFGDKTATCVRGRWADLNVPVCVKSGCMPLFPPRNGEKKDGFGGAVARFSCNSGYLLAGSENLYCDGSIWNSTTPTCKPDVSEPETSCNFEREDDLCGWQQDASDDFDWQRHSGPTPSNNVGTGPSFDHTYGQGLEGHYMYIESSSPRMTNDKARLISPVFKPKMSVDACFIIWYHMFGISIGSLNVYLKPEEVEFARLTPLFTVRDDRGNRWLRSIVKLQQLDTNFQVVVEAVRGSGYIGDAAIDDVVLANGTSCLETATEAPQVSVQPDGEGSWDKSQSCRMRCSTQAAVGSDDVITDESELALEAPVLVVCDCHLGCLQDNATNCCSDYADYCVLAKSTPPPLPPPPPPLPRPPPTTAAVLTYRTISAYPYVPINFNHTPPPLPPLPPMPVDESKSTISPKVANMTRVFDDTTKFPEKVTLITDLTKVTTDMRRTPERTESQTKSTFPSFSIQAQSNMNTTISNTLNTSKITVFPELVTKTGDVDSSDSGMTYKASSKVDVDVTTLPTINYKPVINVTPTVEAEGTKTFKKDSSQMTFPFSQSSFSIIADTSTRIAYSTFSEITKLPTVPTPVTTKSITSTTSRPTKSTSIFTLKPTRSTSVPYLFTNYTSIKTIPTLKPTTKVPEKKTTNHILITIVKYTKKFTKATSRPLMTSKTPKTKQVDKNDKSNWSLSKDEIEKQIRFLMDNDLSSQQKTNKGKSSQQARRATSPKDPGGLSAYSIGGVVGLVVLTILIVTGVMLAAVRMMRRRREARGRGDDGDDDSDVRFLTADEVLDFNLARPRGEREEEEDDV